MKKKSSVLKKLLIGLFVFLGILLIAIITLPILFKDKIVARVKTEINNTVEAKVDFGDVNLSLLRSFPDFSLQLEDLVIDNINEFAGTTLAKADNIDVSLDIMSVIKSDRPIQINSIHLDKPVIHVITRRDGVSNYEIYKSTAETDPNAETSFQIGLSEYSITDAEVIYDDRLVDAYAHVVNLDHSGKGDFTQDIFDLSTKTTAEAITYKSGGVAYLNAVEGDFDVNLNYNVPEAKAILAENQFRLNNLVVKTDGWVQTTWDEILMDLTFEAPANNFRNVLSLIPAAYTKDYSDVKTSGNFVLNGSAKGSYNMSTGALPAINVNLKIDNGQFQYPDLPLGMKDIFADLRVDHPGGAPDRMKIDLNRFKMQLGNNPFEARLKLRTPISNPDIDAVAKGIINLEDLAKAMPLEGVTDMKGIITADLTAKADMAALDRQQYEEVDMAGDLKIENMVYASEGLPAIRIDRLTTDFTPKYVAVKEFTGKLGNSDLKASGRVDNILAYFSPEKTMTGNFDLESKYFDADEWIPEATTDTSGAAAGGEPVAVFDRFNFDVRAKVDKIKYDIYDLKNASMVGSVTSNEATFKDLRLLIGDSDVKGKGKLTNLFPYVFENETLYGELDVNSNFFNLNQFMVETEGDAAAVSMANEEELEPVAIPDKIDIDINANVGKLQYTNMYLTDVNGKLAIEDQAVKINGAQGRTLGGVLAIDGVYDTKNPMRPTFDFKTKINQFRFQEAFKTLNSFAALAPIGKFIDGLFNSTLSFKGELTPDLMPDLSTLTAEGYIETLNSVLGNFPVLEKISDKLSMDEFKTIKLDNTRNWFEVTDGKVVVKDFDVNFKGIDMIVGGVHGVDMDMDYHIMAKIPRALLEKSKVTAAANKGYKFLQTEAGKLGLEIGDAEFINVKMNLGGSMMSPNLNIVPQSASGKSLKDQAADAFAAKKEEVRNEVTAKVDEQKAAIKTEADKQKEILKDKSKSALDTLIADPTNAKDKIKSIFTPKKEDTDSTKTNVTKPADEVKEEVKEGVDKVKNLFKRKKNN